MWLKPTPGPSLEEMRKTDGVLTVLAHPSYKRGLQGLKHSLVGSNLPRNH